MIAKLPISDISVALIKWVQFMQKTHMIRINRCNSPISFLRRQQVRQVPAHIWAIARHSANKREVWGTQT